ncbi:ATP-dependent helicase [Anaeromusa acidaminophila]|uniref:ATP-dependent helicase n=1 Tax=Anaeromusa acidaminophila TaxID=81464 RepID=UPI000369C2D1|nr:ATP-dependent helicase [Anaeromusa acidaminophila]
MGLDQRQQMVVDYPVNTPVCISACAGAGKTTVLIERILHLIDQGFRDYQILALTFTKKAGTEIKTRLASKGGMKAKKVIAGTFHSLALSYLKRASEFVPNPVPYTFDAILSERDKHNIVISLLNEYGYELDPSKLLQFISWQRNSLLMPGDKLDYSLCERDKQEEVTAMYAAYHNKINELKKIDFDDMLVRFYFMLRQNPDFLKRVQLRHRYVLVDEFQDTCVAQHEILKLLASHGRLFAVGDSRQSIYSWRAARPDILLNFKDNWQKSEMLSLDTNYRSAGPIVELADFFIQQGLINYPGRTLAFHKEGLPVSFKAYNDEIAEAKGVVKEVDRLIQAGTDPKDICILFRTNGQSISFENELAISKIPFYSPRTNFFKSEAVKITLAYLRLMVESDNVDALRLAVKTPPRNITDSYIQNKINLARDNNMPLAECFYSEDASDDAIEFANLMGMLRRFSKRSPVDAIAAIMAMTECSKYVTVSSSPDSSAQEMENLLLSQARQFDSIAGFLSHLNLLQTTGNNEEEGVRLLTIHSAKGMEFPIVFLVGIADGIFPARTSTEVAHEGSLSPLEEERRLCYVGITRAKKNLYISSLDSYAERLLPGASFFDELRTMAHSARED